VLTTPSSTDVMTGFRPPAPRRHRGTDVVRGPGLDPGCALRSRHLPCGRPPQTGALGRGVPDGPEPAVLAKLDEIEGYAPDDPEPQPVRARKACPSRSIDGRRLDGWVYFYNAPLGQAQRIPSGDYLDRVKARYPIGTTERAPPALAAGPWMGALRPAPYRPGTRIMTPMSIDVVSSARPHTGLGSTRRLTQHPRRGARCGGGASGARPGGRAAHGRGRVVFGHARQAGSGPNPARQVVRACRSVRHRPRPDDQQGVRLWHAGRGHAAQGPSSAKRPWWWPAASSR